MAELCLGTVQFGMKYGINNQSGQPAEEEVFEILDTAVSSGIHMVDTASAYGASEEILGRYLKEKKNTVPLKVVSKLSPGLLEGYGGNPTDVIRRELEDTLKRLQQQQLDGYLLHEPQYIHDPKIVEALQHLKEEKLTEHIGISIYETLEGYAALKTGVFDYIQLPYNVLDQRGMQEGLIQEAEAAGMTVFTRSVFLQGLLMMEKERIPEHLRQVHPYLERFEGLCEKYQISRMDALIHFVTEEEKIHYLVFGVDTREQLIEFVDIYQNHTIPEGLTRELKTSFTDVEKDLILPSLWGKKKEQR